MQAIDEKIAAGELDENIGEVAEVYYDEDGKTLIGYDLDLINDLQDLLGFEIDGGIQAMDYSALTTSLAENKLDMGAAALCATDERKEFMKELRVLMT